jgi:hypothetical protein
LAHADQGLEKILVTLITASDEGSDFNLDNDKYRDELIKLFSYHSYNQKNQTLLDLKKAEHQIVSLIEGYELVLTLQGDEKERVIVQALVRKDGKVYVNTVMSILKNGVVFLGGPTTNEGALILILERM